MIITDMRNDDVKSATETWAVSDKDKVTFNIS